MNSIGNLSLALPSPITSTTLTSVAGQSGPASFGEYMKTAVESLDQIQRGAEQEIARAVTGESQDLHRTVATLQSADLAFQLGLQIRNKFINAYEEVMRMQV